MEQDINKEIISAQKQGEELNQLSRLLFDKASQRWYLAMGLEVVSGGLGVVIGTMLLSDKWRTIVAAAAFVFLALIYYLKIRSNYLYSTAETMRRQSVLAEAIGWPISATQFSDWRLKAGKELLNKFKVSPRDEDYYMTKCDVGAERLLEMTIESCFYTRHLYEKIRKLASTILIVTIIAWILALSVIPFDDISNVTRLRVVYLLYLALPIILSADILGWTIKLGTLSRSIKEIEQDLERLSKSGDLDIPQVMRLVSEYNCQLVGGIPIPKVLFRLWHNEIRELWEKRMA